MNLKEKVEIYKTEALSIAYVSRNVRFIIIEKSISLSSFFTHTIIDTKEGKECDGKYWKKSVCETTDEEKAVIICYSLNQYYLNLNYSG